MPRLPRQTFTTEQELPDHQARFGEQLEPMREMDEESSEDENAVANTGASLSASIPLKAPVPPQFEAAIGYQGDARYVALYWQPAGDEARYNDGHVSGDGDWWAWLAYVEHAAVASHLAQTCSKCDGWGELPDTQQGLCPRCLGDGKLTFNFGHSDCDADHWLILDRQERKVYAAPVRAAHKLLADQWPPPPDLSAVDEAAIVEAFEEALEEFKREWQPPSDEEITARLEAAKELCADMTTWLDGQVGEGSRHSSSSSREDE